MTDADRLMEILSNCPADSRLHAFAHEGGERLLRSESVSVQFYPAMERDRWLRIYRIRLEHCRETGFHVPGLVETVASVEAGAGLLHGGHAITGMGMISFWCDESGTLAGVCLHSPENNPFSEKSG